jgi:hypothetical protein
MQYIIFCGHILTLMIFLVDPAMASQQKDGSLRQVKVKFKIICPAVGISRQLLSLKCLTQVKS